MDKERTAINFSNSISGKPTCLIVSPDTKRYVELCAKSAGESVSMHTSRVLQLKLRHFEGDIIDSLKAVSKAYKSTLKGFCDDKFRDLFKVRMEDFHNLTADERVELFEMHKKLFNGPTWAYNAEAYLLGKKEADLSWTLAFKKALDELKELS